MHYSERVHLKQEAVGQPFAPLYFTPLHQYAYSPYCSPYISKEADKENLFNNHKLVNLVIILFTLMTLMSNPGVIL